MSVVLPPVTPQFGMTLEEMITDISNEIRNKSIDSLITGWINQSILQISAFHVFGSLHKHSSQVTTPNIPDITLEADIHWLKTVQNTTDIRKIYPRDELLIAEEMPDYRTRTGTIQWYYQNDVIMGLSLVPDTTKTIEYAYQKRPKKLSVLADISDLPPEWHPLITLKAKLRGFAYESNQPMMTETKEEIKKLERLLGANVYKRPDDIVVMGSEERGSKPARPKLPSHYPSV